MRFKQFGLSVCVLLLAIPAWGKQPSQNASTSQPASDPQAVAIVQAAITVLGGTAAIGQAQSWTFQAQMRGAFINDIASYTMSTDSGTGGFVSANGMTLPLRMTRSHFVPALVGLILLTESQDAEFTVKYGGTSTFNSEPVTVIVFQVGPDKAAGQTWFFDAANLPVQISFQFPAEVGTRKSVFGTVALSGYKSVSGVLYPTKIVEVSHFAVAEIITLQSVTVSATASPNESNPSAADSL
jgi:hypothetical protein